MGLLFVCNIQQIIFRIGTDNPDFVQGTEQVKEQII